MNNTTINCFSKTPVLSMICAALLLTGCGTDTGVYIKQDGALSATEDAALTEDVTSTEESGTGSPDISDDSSNEEIFVYVCGAINNPGVYELSSGSRMYEAIELAGGFTDDACKEALNLADEVTDAQMIWVPTIEEAEEGGLIPSQTTDGSSAGQSVYDTDGRIDLNSATAEQLVTLPGIGQSKADSIIAYRNSHGSFSSIEDIMNVDGIKEGVYNRIKDSIKVN